MSLKKYSQIPTFDTLAEINNLSGDVGDLAVAQDTPGLFRFDGTKWISILDYPLKKLTSTSSAPTITPMTGAGTGATGSASGTNVAGTITFTTGVGLGTNADLFTIQLGDSATFPNKMIVQLQALDPTTLGVLSSIFQSVSNPSSATIKMKGLGLSVSTTYVFTYQIMGY